MPFMVTVTDKLSVTFVFTERDHLKVRALSPSGFTPIALSSSATCCGASP